jgi:uncharacterized protein YdcH (DUF465 family)
MGYSDKDFKTIFDEVRELDDRIEAATKRGRPTDGRLILLLHKQRAHLQDSLKPAHK